LLISNITSPLASWLAGFVINRNKGKIKMAIEQLIQAVCAATPAKRKKLEAVLNGTNTNTKAEAVPSKLVTISEAARILNVCRATIHKLADAGRLEKVLLTNRSRITMKSIIDYTSGNR